MRTDIMDSKFIEHKTLRTYQRSSLVLGFAFCIFFWYFSAWLSFIAPASFILIVGISIILERINYSRFASVLLVISIWLAPAWCILFSGGLYSPLLIWLTPPIFMAGVLLGSQWALFIGSLSFSFILGIFFYNEALNILTEFNTSAGLSVLSLLSGTSAVILITFYGYVFTRDLKNKAAEIIISRDEAVAANEVKSEFLSCMSHELRTPMNAILGFGQLLEIEAEELSETQQSHIKEILTAGQHLLHLINEILDLGKIESGKIEISIEEVAVDDVLRQCLPLIQTQINEHQIELVDHLSSQGHVVYADLIRLKQVLLNLLSNAVKYNQTHGRITLDSEIIDEQRLRIRVTDTGEGLSEKDIARLFTPFERLNNVYNIEGTGIGLVICKNIVELMGGDIGVESEPGSGCTFWVELPRVTLDNS